METVFHQTRDGIENFNIYATIISAIEIEIELQGSSVPPFTLSSVIRSRELWLWKHHVCLFKRKSFMKSPENGQKFLQLTVLFISMQMLTQALHWFRRHMVALAANWLRPLKSSWISSSWFRIPRSVMNCWSSRWMVAAWQNSTVNCIWLSGELQLWFQRDFFPFAGEQASSLGHESKSWRSAWVLEELLPLRWGRG